MTRIAASAVIVGLALLMFAGPTLAYVTGNDWWWLTVLLLIFFMA